MKNWEDDLLPEERMLFIDRVTGLSPIECYTLGMLDGEEIMSRYWKCGKDLFDVIPKRKSKEFSEKWFEIMVKSL